MLPKYHILVGFISSLIIYLIFPITILQAAIIFFSSFLIDVDHYLLYVYKKKDFSFKNSVIFFRERRRKWIAMNLEERKKYKKAIFIFHGIEFWLLLIILSFYINLIWFVLLGIAIHILLDYIDLINNKDYLYSKFSQFYVYLKNKGKRDFL